MASYNTLNWQNENALSSHPFDSDIEVQDFIVDANFVQFDSFVPTLNYIYVAASSITLDITFDFGQLGDLVLSKELYESGSAYRHIRIYHPTNARYLGTVVFGTGTSKVWQQYIGQNLNIATQFSASVVRNIPSKDAVYLFDSIYGDVLLTRAASDSTIFYNIAENSNSITFNAVGGHAVSEVIGEELATSKALRQINLVKPLNNNINLASNDVIKITPYNATSLKVSLVSGSKNPAFAAPTLIA